MAQPLLGPGVIDPASNIPVPRQLADAIHRLIERGDLKTGDELPSIRALAQWVGHGKGSVEAAYQLLAHDGVLIQRGGGRQRAQVRGPALARRMSANRYADELARARAGQLDPDQTAFCRDYGCTWQEYTVDAAYRTQPANKAQAAALEVTPKTSVLRRVLVEKVREVPVQLRRSIYLRSDVEGTAVADVRDQPWPGGTVAEIMALGHEITAVRERAVIRRASPAEVRDLWLPDHHQLLEVTRTFCVPDQRGRPRPIEVSEVARTALGSEMEWETWL